LAAAADVPLKRVSVRVPVELAEEIRAVLADVCPCGWEEHEHGGELELAAYGGSQAEALWRQLFADVRVARVAPDWGERWRVFHRGLRVGRLWVGPPWEPPPAAAVAVIIDPGMAFGTGAHPTTRLCLEVLLDQRPGSIVDLGCGSGVLAVAAAKLGFSPVMALDRDPAAVLATRDNASANGVRVDVGLADVTRDELPEVELALANLELAAIPLVAARFRGRRLIASGYLAREAARPPGWRRVLAREREGWTAALFERC
jgi:ribosomal protein L11 methyltransferase